MTDCMAGKAWSTYCLPFTELSLPTHGVNSSKVNEYCCAHCTVKIWNVISSGEPQSGYTSSITSPSFPTGDASLNFSIQLRSQTTSDTKKKSAITLSAKLYPPRWSVSLACLVFHSFPHNQAKHVYTFICPELNSRLSHFLCSYY